MNHKSPEISIIIIVGDERARASAALESVLEQRGIARAEIILVDLSKTSEVILASKMNTRVIMVNATSNEYGRLKAEAVRRARGRIVAFLEDHVIVHPGWLEAILADLKDPWVAIGAEIHNANPGVGISDTMSLLNYGLWMPPIEPGETEWVPGNNSAYLRSALEEAGDQLSALLAADMVLQHWLKERGSSFYTTPSAAISHLNETKLVDAARAMFYYHWCFAANRAAMLAWSSGKRVLHVILSPLIAWLRWVRLMKLLLSRKQSGVTRAALALLLIHISLLGQNAGLLFGPEVGNRAMVEIELHVPREMKRG